MFFEDLAIYLPQNHKTQENATQLKGQRKERYLLKVVLTKGKI